MTDEHPPTTTAEVPAAIADEPPATKLIYLLVERNEPTTHGALRSASGLSDQTVRDALATCRGHDLVIEAVHPSDQRQDIYRTA